MPQSGTMEKRPVIIGNNEKYLIQPRIIADAFTILKPKEEKLVVKMQGQHIGIQRSRF